MTDYDAIIIGAGHNGLAAGTVLAKRGLRVLTLEKNRALRAMLSFAAIQSTYKGPYTPEAPSAAPIPWRPTRTAA